MARLVYSAICSLDGFIADDDGDFAWAAPDAQVHAFANELERGIGTHLFGRRMYEVMQFWEGRDAVPDQEPVMLDFAQLWASTDKHVYSTTLPTASTARTTMHRAFDPREIARMKVEAAADIGIGGPTLAAHAFRAGLVDDLHMIVIPTMVGGGTRALPLDCRIGLERVDMHAFDGGVVHLHYRVS